MISPADPCERIRSELVAFREGDLSPGTAGSIRIHLRMCASCRDRWSEFEELDARIAAIAPPRTRAGFSERAVAAMTNAVRAPRASERRERRRAAPALPLLALAASLLLGFLFVFFVDRPRPRATEATIAPFQRLAREPFALASGRLLSGATAGDLALPLPPTDGIGRIAQILASR